MSRLFRYTIRVSGAVTAIGALATAACYYDFQRQYSPPHIWSTKPHKYSLSNVLAQSKPNPNATTHLSPSQIEQYNRDGYVVARNVIPISYIEAMRCEALYYASKYRGTLYPFDKYSGRNAIHRPSLHSNWAYHLSQNLGNIGVGSLTSQLFSNKSIHLVFDTLDYILPGQKSAYLAPIRKETHGHRDGVRCWIPLEDISINNSAPIVIPGSHLWTEECFMGHGPCALCFASSLKDTPKCPCNSELLNNKNKWNTQIFSDLKKGDIIFINPKTLHSTGGPNNTQTPRLGMRLHLKTQNALNDYKYSKRYKRVQNRYGWTNMLLRGWSPSHPRVLNQITAPQVWPIIDENLNIKNELWPMNEPTFYDCIIFALGSAARWSVWYAIGSRKILQPPQYIQNEIQNEIDYNIKKESLTQT